MADEKTIELSAKEVDFLLTEAFLPASLRDAVLGSRAKESQRHSIRVGHALAEEFKDCFTERLAVGGFGKDYELNAHGKILESLIDKFTIF